MDEDFVGVCRRDSSRGGSSNSKGISRKLRSIKSVLIGTLIVSILVLIVVCAGTALILVVTIPMRGDVKTLLTRVETVEDSISSLRSDVLAAIKMHGANVPVSMRNFHVPAHLLKEVPDIYWKSKVKASPNSKTGELKEQRDALSRSFIGRFVQAISDLDKGNKEILKDLNQSIAELKSDIEERDMRKDQMLEVNSKQLLELSNATNEIGNKLFDMEIENRFDTVIDSIEGIERNISLRTLPSSTLIQRIQSITNDSLRLVGKVLDKEMVKIRNATDTLKNISKSTQIIATQVQNIENETEALKSDLNSIHKNLVPVEEKVAILLTEQNLNKGKYDNFANNIENIRLKAESIDRKFSVTTEDRKQLADVTKNTSRVISDIQKTQVFLMEALQNDSRLFDLMLTMESSTLSANMSQFQTVMKEEFRNAMNSLETVIGNTSVAFSSSVRNDIHSVINERFENGLQMMENMMRDESASQSSTDMKPIMKLINKEFVKGFKMIQKEMKNRSRALSQAPGHFNSKEKTESSTVVNTKLCTASQGCTTIEHASKRCFKVIDAAKDKASWINAKRKCQRMGGYLAEVFSSHEYDILIKSLPSYGNYWLGGTDRGYEGYWHWDQSRHKISLNGWAPGQPNNQNYVEHCLHIIHDDLTFWNDFRCTAKMGYICETKGSACDSWSM